MSGTNTRSRHNSISNKQVDNFFQTPTVKSSSTAKHFMKRQGPDRNLTAQNTFGIDINVLKEWKVQGQRISIQSEEFRQEVSVANMRKFALAIGN